jgi:hypothetical protein
MGTVVNSYLPVSIPPPFHECSSICVINKLLDAMCTANLKWHIKLYFNPNNLQVSTSNNLTWLPPPLLPFFTLTAPTNTLVSLCLQLMKATVLAKSSLYFIFLLGSLCSSNVYRHESSRCCTFPYF